MIDSFDEPPAAKLLSVHQCQSDNLLGLPTTAANDGLQFRDDFILGYRPATPIVEI